ncbi:MAG: hypothetical protein GEV05_10650 [Betaproteobacteria bacterium]|nr:hypothetical protein [Betaproteobacteria bacterium]
MPDEKSYERITRNDLKRLLSIARQEREDFFSRHKEYAILYGKRMLCAALCDGAALHFTNGQTGVRTFDVFTFYAEHPEASFPHWHEERYDFGPGRKFGRLPDAPESFRGRPVNLAGRSIDASPADDPIEALQYYLRRGASPVARRLAEQAVVLLEPEKLMGYVAWPTLVPARPAPIGAQ